jgi:hypothetical protein
MGRHFEHIAHVDAHFNSRLATGGIGLLHIAIGSLSLSFGAPKRFPHLRPIEDLAARIAVPPYTRR